MVGVTVTYVLTYERHSGPMPGACEACDRFQMEQDAECVVAKIGEVVARVFCMPCVDALVAARGKSTPAERTANARAALAAKRAAKAAAEAAAKAVAQEPTVTYQATAPSGETVEVIPA